MRRLVVDLNEARPVWRVPEWSLEEIRSALPDEWMMEVVRAISDGRGDGGGASAEALGRVRSAEVYIGFGVARDLFLAATGPPESRLRWVHSGTAGVGGSLFPEMVSSDVVLTNSAGIHAEPIAETVLAMILHFARGLDFAVRAQAAGEWHKLSFEAADTPVREISGSTLGILGYGGIGRAVARRGRALGMRVLALRRRAGESEEAEILAGEGALGRLLEASDYLVVAVPETESTRGLIGERELARMPPHSVLVNVARGAVVDEDALVYSLRERRLRGAALDVFQEEPLPAESELWRLPNVLITPHVSGTSRRFWRRETDLIVSNLSRYLTGKPLLNVVDKHAGY